MTEKEPVSKKGISPDWFMRGALGRIGGTVDKFLGRDWVPSSSLATSELVERLKKLLDAEAINVDGKGKVVPHNIKLKIEWEKFASDETNSLDKLESELLIATADHINDQLYYTYAPLRLEVRPDYFTKGVKLFASFDKFAQDEHEGTLDVTVPAIDVREALKQLDHVKEIEAAGPRGSFSAHFEINGIKVDRTLDFPADGRLTVGRTGSNGLMVDDHSVSKIHASLLVGTDGTLSVADTGSTNGTFINDERIAYGKAIRLEDADRVTFGSVDVKFERLPATVENAPAEAAPNDTVEIDGLEFRSRPSIQTEAAAEEMQDSDSLSKVDTLPMDADEADTPNE
ncbi:MAG TPA: FHA domain-containing protein [Pyrinomonadaceae bacterium]|nr:FHA domain-containing protein [Pyrinomonadaceae bacterium]